jgi:hypothetical protein
MRRLLRKRKTVKTQPSNRRRGKKGGERVRGNKGQKMERKKSKCKETKRCTAPLRGFQEQLGERDGGGNKASKEETCIPTMIKSTRWNSHKEYAKWTDRRQKENNSTRKAREKEKVQKRARSKKQPAEIIHILQKPQLSPIPLWSKVYLYNLALLLNRKLRHQRNMITREVVVGEARNLL